ncbi:hypothetical protein V7S43_016147 [Phytophthora oleae]|uniref:HRDC domain-containing protein n=1 Tax=Phytophthora oleae TaxID=2107226 RepID=A0ABD3EWE2_9STRA
MRVKKLNVNRRHKAGEDEAVAAGGDSEQRKWVSPTKPRRSVRTGSNSGSSSPTDVQQQQQHLGKHSPLYGGSGGVAVMPNATLDVVMHEEDKNPMRKAMIDRIVETLRAMKPHAPEKVLAALPRLAQHMEKTLYKLAKNEAEYCDQSTLRLRIAHIQENNAKRLLAQQQPQTPECNGNAAPPLQPLSEEQARILFQHLQCWRQKLVNMYGVAPWEILPNPTLAKVALYMPSTEQELAVCGVDHDKIARFGSSLVQELQRLRGPPPNKPVTRPIKAKPGRKPSPGKRGPTEPFTAGTNKKRKNGEAAPRLAPAAPAPSFNGTPLMSAAPLLPAVDSLPTLLPTVSMIPSGVTGSAGVNSMAMKQSPFSTTAGARLSPGPISQQQQQFLTRLQPQQQQGSPSPAQENHMHLLVQGAGQLSKQQNVKSVEAYEQEVQSLRWMLHQSQQEKAQLEMEIQRLRTELQGRNGAK